MRVLFIDHTPETYVNDNEPLGLMWLSASLKAAGHQCAFSAPRMSDIERVMEQFKPQVVGFSVIVGYHGFYTRLNEAISRRWKVFSVFGGPQTTYHPEYIERSSAIDAICRGEGELALVELMDRIEAGRDYTDVENFYFQTPDGIKRNPVRPLVENLDALPFPDRELIYSVYPPSRLNSVKLVMTMRGCPFNCTYCFNPSFNKLYKGKGPVIRRRSVDNVIAEINDIKARYPLSVIHFLDDTFTLMPKWVDEFCDKYPRECGVPFVLHLRLNAVNPTLAAKLKAAGCATAMVGVESGEPRVRREILKHDNMNNEQMIAGCRTLMEHGIRVINLNMLGIPGAGFESDMMTYELNRRCRPTYARSCTYIPYLGTESADYAIQLGIYDGNADNIGPDSYVQSASALKLEHPRKVANLVMLLGFGVQYNLPVRVMRFLISLPLKPVYALIHMLLKAHAGMVTFPARRSLAELVYLIRRMLKLHSTEITDAETVRQADRISRKAGLDLDQPVVKLEQPPAAEQACSLPIHGNRQAP